MKSTPMITLNTLLENINTWRTLMANIQNAFPDSDLNSKVKLEAIRKNCSHGVYVHTSTIYTDDGFCDPDFQSHYQCLICGSTDYTVPANRYDGSLAITMVNYCSSDRYYTDEEKFGILDYRLRQIIKEHPNWTLDELVKFLNRELYKA